MSCVQALDELVVLRRPLPPRQRGEIAFDDRRARVGLPDARDLHAARRYAAAPREDRHLHAGGDEPGRMHAHDLLDPAEHGGGGVVDESDAAHASRYASDAALARATRPRAPPIRSTPSFVPRRTRNDTGASKIRRSRTSM